MTVTVLYIILAVAATVAVLLAFVLVSPLSVRIRYEEAIEVFAGFSFLKIKVFPKREKKQKTKAKKQRKVKSSADKAAKREKEATTETKSQEKKAAGTKKSSVKETLLLVFEIVKGVFEAFGKGAQIDIDLLKVIISKPDAADTAVQFGICGGIVSNILAFTSNFKKANINDKNILVEPDFVTGKGSLAVDITVKIRTFYLVGGLVKGYIRGISHK